MNKEFFVQNVKKYCAVRGVKPTVACRESGAGVNFINKIMTQGSIPSVERVQLLAQYLGVSTSELLGETTSFFAGEPPQPDLVRRYNALSQDDLMEIMTLVEMKYQKAMREIQEAEKRENSSN